MEGELINYYFREKLYHHMQKSCHSGLEINSSDQSFNLYLGVAYFLSGKLNKALSKLEALITEPHISLAALLALIYFHKQCEMPDKQAIHQWELSLKEEKRLPHEMALYHAANVLFMIGKVEKAREYLQRLMKLTPESPKGLTLKGWVELKEGNSRNALSCFRSVLSKDQFCIDAVFGEIKIIPPIDGLTKLNKLIVKYPNLIAPLIEKMRLHLAAFDWQLTLDTANRILAMEPNNLIGRQVKLFYMTCFEGNYQEVSTGLQQLYSELDRQESQSWVLLYDWSALFARICGRDDGVLTATRNFLENALLISGNNLTLINELAYQFYLSKRYKDATKYYRDALKIDKSSLTALTGLTLTALNENGVTPQIVQQVDFLMEIADSAPNPEIMIMQAQCHQAKVADLCDKVIEKKFQSVSTMSFGCAYLSELNPDFILYILDQYPSYDKRAENKVKILKKLCKLCPGLVSAWSQLALTQVNHDLYDEAMITLKHITSELDPMNADSYLLMAKIHQVKEDYDDANNNLELALSYNLKVRERPLFHLLNGIVQKHCGDLASCVKSLKNALAYDSGDEKLCESDLATLYVELSNSYQQLNQLVDAGECLKEAATLFNNTKYEPIFTISNADLALFQNNVSSALKLLASITPDQSCYIDARTKMAEIHLKYNKNGNLYAECYRELAASNPTAENFVRLADAYLSIQEPEKAVESYEEAMKLNAEPELACKLARVLVKTHQYSQAVKCFKESGEAGCIELSYLLVKLGQLQAAENCLNDVPLTKKVFVLSQICEKRGDVSKACRLLLETYEKINQSDVVLAAKICKQLAEYCTNLRDFDAAINYYKKWLSISSPNGANNEFISVNISLAKLYLQVNDWKACEVMCSSILATHANNEPALLMMADLAFRRCDFTAADAHFGKLIARHPTYFVAIARLIEVKRRLGILDEAKVILDKIASSAKNDPGFNYCQGLYNWYSNNESEAMDYFNAAQSDIEWGQQALHNMVEICLAKNTGQELAQKLLSKMKPSNVEEEMNCKLLEGFVLLASKDPAKIDKAMTSFTSLVSQETMKIGATLGLSTGYILLKQSSRAKNVLKRIAKSPWQFEEAEHLEKCWLMLADLHLQSSKYELAAELLKRVLAHNQACAKAYEFYGVIAEKDQKYHEASIQYQEAWQLTQKSDPNLGFKLAFNLLKAKRYADSIDICQSIPNTSFIYPRIRKDVLEKAINHLKT